mmetsp:Transcript_18373/g.61906  ORF Transcript_18373/g.61906 Transcript_18373/m.61906 type:complete len:414 (+) Transcript_18373:89-1330(+)
MQGSVESAAAVEMHAAACAVAEDESDPRAASLDEAHRTVQGQLLRLKPWTYAAIAALLAVTISIGAWHYQLMLVVVLLLVPTLGPLIRWWTLHPEQCPLDHILASYAHGLFLLSLASMGTGIIFAQFTVVVFGPLLSLLFTRQLWVLGVSAHFTLFWAVFCFVEELWSVSTLRQAVQRRAHRSTNGAQAHSLYASASAMGYATAQCVLLSCIVTAFMEGHTRFELKEEHAHGGEITVNETVWLFALAVVFAWFWLPLRLVASHLHCLVLAQNADKPLAEGRASDDGGDGCIESVCPLPGDVSAAGSMICVRRLGHLWTVIKWPWALRTAHMTQFVVWFYVLVPALGKTGLILWVFCTFFTWSLIMVAARWKIRQLEALFNPQGSAGAANLRALYGFSLLANEEDDATVDATVV